MLRIALALTVALTAAHSIGGQDRDVQRKALLGKVPSEIVAAEENWFRGSAATLAGLKGNVVWLQFNF